MRAIWCSRMASLVIAFRISFSSSLAISWARSGVLTRCPQQRPPCPCSRTHLRCHHSDLLGGYDPTQHVPPQVRVLSVLEVGDAAPHTVFVLHVRVPHVPEDACRCLRTYPEANTAAFHSPRGQRRRPVRASWWEPGSSVFPPHLAASGGAAEGGPHPTQPWPRPSPRLRAPVTQAPPDGQHQSREGPPGQGGSPPD